MSERLLNIAVGEKDGQHLSVRFMKVLDEQTVRS